MKQFGFEDAIQIIETDKYAQFEKVSTTKHVVLSPKYLGRVKTGIVEQLNSELNFSSESLDGILIAYSNIQLLQRVGQILDEQPYIHFKIQADFIVFKPVVGCLLRGVVNKVSKNHIGCLVHNRFNASLARPNQAGKGWAGQHMSVGEEFIFQVTHVYSHNKFLSIKGKLTNEGSPKKLNKKRTWDDVEEVPDSGDMVDIATTGSQDNTDDITDVTLTKPKSKKKKKHRDNKEEESVNDVSFSQISDTQANESDSSHRKHKKKKRKKERLDESCNIETQSLNTSLLYNEEVVASSEKMNGSLDISGVYPLEASPMSSSTCRKKKKAKKSRKSEQEPDTQCNGEEQPNKPNSLTGNTENVPDIDPPNSPLLFSSQDVDENSNIDKKKHKKSKKHKKEKDTDTNS
ncbi:DNA-directed RNA polymerase I subunit RPA43-like [Argopecten irradians]|uniref:DNA-directed RNA polymerase I subunit RPA43-like n=1 Tax=Argopecten irradians TaxID=31199 RepID=UPI003723D153